MQDRGAKRRMSKMLEDALILEQQELAVQTYRLRLHAPRIAEQARPGQFVMLRVSDGLDPLLRRPFSFHRIVSEEGIIEILYRVVGRGTWRLAQCDSGTRLNLIGPLGNAFELPEEGSRPVVLVAGGIGIAPLFELIARLCSNRGAGSARKHHLFYGARTAAELLPAASFDEFGIVAHWSTDDGSLGHAGYVTRLLQRVMEKDPLRPAMLYACGPLAMQYHVAKWALAQGVASQLSLESLMACGLGACLGCALPAPHPTDPSLDHYLHVCKDGPIFAAGSIQWQKIRLQPPPPQIFQYS